MTLSKHYANLDKGGNSTIAGTFKTAVLVFAFGKKGPGATSSNIGLKPYKINVNMPL